MSPVRRVLQDGGRLRVTWLKVRAEQPGRSKDSAESGCLIRAAADTIQAWALRNAVRPTNQRPFSAFTGGALIGVLGGLIGLGGAEFRLPLLIGVFRFRPLEAIILNKAMSLMVVAAALVFRTGPVPLDLVTSHIEVVVNLLAGSLLGAWYGANWATRMQVRTLYRLIAVLLVGIAAVLLIGHASPDAISPALMGGPLWIAGMIAGFGIGVVASLMGAAGGELLIPTFVLLFGLDIKLAGSLSLLVSLPTMLVGFARYSRDQSFAVLRRNSVFVAFMAAGSIVGALLGGLLLGIVSGLILYPLLAFILLLSAIKVWRHE